MKNLTNIKLLPTTNPNYTMKESAEEFIRFMKDNGLGRIDGSVNND